MSHFVALNQSQYNIVEDHNYNTNSSSCICCLARNVPFIDLTTCKHAEFFETFFKCEIEYFNTIACHHCHEMLRKIEFFKEQVKESMIILKRQAINYKVHRLYNLQSSNTEITVNINPENVENNEFMFKDELTEDNDDITDIKSESDLSDYETEVPLSEIKKKKEESKSKCYLLKLKPIKKERSGSEPSPFLDENYLGKLKMLLLSKDELERERDDLRRETKYMKLPYKCESCIIGFNRELYLKKHIQQRHKQETGMLICDVCKSVFNSKISLKPHYKRHFIRYECKRCGKRYIDERAIVSHYNEKHGKDGATVHNKFKCKLDDCGFETHSYRSFMYHRSKHDSYPCKLCNKVYVKWKQLRSHIYGVHKQTQTTYKCEKCDKVYKQRCGLRIHMQSAHNSTDRTPYCAPCRMHFRTRNNLKQHLRQHSNHVTEADKKYMCDNCGARFITKSNLKGHIEWVHLKKSDFQCPQCFKVVKTARSLKNHIEFVHEKKQLPRDKMCDYCGKGFTMRRCLQAHIRTHTGERPYQCVRCTATFAHSASLYNHNKLVHNPLRDAADRRTRS